MTNDDNTGKHRRSVRLRGYDYASVGAYFVTICAAERACVFGAIVDGAMRLNEAGWVVENEWHHLPIRFPHITLDAAIVMPNHWHGIIVLTDDVGAGFPRPHPTNTIAQDDGFCSLGAETAPLRGKRESLGQIVAFFKYQTTKRINVLHGTPGARIWQRNYYEHIVRNEADLARLREYIVNNPLRWELDQLHPDNPSKW